MLQPTHRTHCSRSRASEARLRASETGLHLKLVMIYGFRFTRFEGLGFRGVGFRFVACGFGTKEGSGNN